MGSKPKEQRSVYPLKFAKGGEVVDDADAEKYDFLSTELPDFLKALKTYDRKYEYVIMDDIEVIDSVDVGTYEAMVVEVAARYGSAARKWSSGWHAPFGGLFEDPDEEMYEEIAQFKSQGTAVSQSTGKMIICTNCKGHSISCTTCNNLGWIKS